MVQAPNYFCSKSEPWLRLIAISSEPRLRLILLLEKDLSHDSEMQVLVKIGVLEKIWLHVRNGL